MFPGTLAGEDVSIDEAEQTSDSVFCNFTRGRTTLGQGSWDLGEWGLPLIEELSVPFEFASMLGVLETSFPDGLVLVSDSSFSLAARACWRVGEVNRDVCG